MGHNVKLRPFFAPTMVVMMRVISTLVADRYDELDLIRL